MVETWKTVAYTEDMAASFSTTSATISSLAVVSATVGSLVCNSVIQLDEQSSFPPVIEGGIVYCNGKMYISQWG